MTRAFSLVELSIVLVILGLLTGGILTGQSLIAAAELRAVSTEHQRWVSASQTFRDKYFSLPGDMRNATDFWGIATCPGDSDDPRTGLPTCNGNGDGNIEGGLMAGTNTSNESFNFWQHLSNAGLIEGTYSGVPDNPATSNVYVVLRGVNAPASKLGGTAAWSIRHRTAMDNSSSSYIDGVYENALEFGESSGANGLYNPSLTPEQAWNIDKKMDDGLPGSGRMMVREHSTVCYLLADGSAGAASTTETRRNITYNLTNTNPVCTAIFPNAI